jgi:hypothetical protein
MTPSTTTGAAVLEAFIGYDHFRVSFETLDLLIWSSGEKRVAARSPLIVRQSPDGAEPCAVTAAGAVKAKIAATPRLFAPRIPIPSVRSKTNRGLPPLSIDFVPFKQDQRL